MITEENWGGGNKINKKNKTKNKTKTKVKQKQKAWRVKQKWTENKIHNQHCERESIDSLMQSKGSTTAALPIPKKLVRSP